MTSRHAREIVEGLTQASRVMPELSCSELEFGTFTRALVPLKFNAPPNLPVVDQVVFKTVPAFPFPEESATVVPAPSSNEYAATSPGVAAEAGVAPSATTTAAETAPNHAPMRPRDHEFPVVRPRRMSIRFHRPVIAGIANHIRRSACRRYQCGFGGSKALAPPERLARDGR